MKKVKFLSLIIITMLLLTGCGKVEEKKKDNPKKDGLVLKENLDLEINSEVNLLSLVSKDNKAEIVSKDEKVDTSVLGEKELVIKYNENGEEKEHIFKVKVVDTKAPTIEFKKELSTTVGKKIDLLINVKVSDNSKEKIKAIVEGKYDINKEGTYKLKYVATDSSNNKIEEEFTLKVSKQSCNLKRGTLTDKRPEACDYTTITLTWEYQDGEKEWAFVGEHGLVYTPSEYKKFEPTKKDLSKGTQIIKTIYKIN